jgi:hypothetical protein
MCQYNELLRIINLDLRYDKIIHLAKMEVAMNDGLCASIAIFLILAFTAVNLFLPYALLVVALFIGLAFVCGMIKRRGRSSECPLGFC